MSPDTFDIFLTTVHQFPHIETVYHYVPQLGGSNITMQYNKEKLEFIVTYKNPKSRVKESTIVLSNEDMRILKSDLPSVSKIPFIKDMHRDEGFEESQSF
jgi:hypothetical protein